jgi:NHLM bacteriocin system ABC transporter ATP-binding protein
MKDSFQSIAWLKQRLGAACVEVPVQGDRPLLLDDPSCAYVTLSEHHQLFCVGYERGAPIGRREHLALCEPGQLVFGLEPPPVEDATALLLSGVSGSVVWRIPTALFFRLVEDPEGRPIVERLFDEWLNLLIGTLPGAPVPTRCRTVGAGETVSLELDGGPLSYHHAPLSQYFRAPAEGAFRETTQAQGGMAVRAKDGLVWVAPATSPRIYLGVDVGRIRASARCWPLTSQAWALCEGSPLLARRSAELLIASGGAAFASEFSAFVVSVAAARRAQLAKIRLERDAVSDRAERVFLSRSLAELAAVGSGERVEPEVGGSDAFERTCRTIAHFLGIAPPRIVDSPGSSLSTMQAALSRMIGIRTRPVLLEKGWQEHDSGPLLGFLLESDESLHPVALLPERGGYVLRDPRTEIPRRVGANLVDSLHPQAHQFYAPMPAGSLKPLDVLRFASRGARRDVIFALVVGMATGSIATLIPLLTGLVFDRIIPGAERGLLWHLALVLLAVYSALLLFDVARGLMLVRAQTRMDTTLEAGVWDRLLNLPLPFFRKYSAGDLAARAAGIGGIREVLAGATLSVMLSGVFSIWNFGLLFYIDSRLALAATGLVAIASIVAAIAAYYGLKRRRRVAELDGTIGGLLLQLFGGISKLRVTGAENRAFGVWSRLFVRRRVADLGAERVNVRVAVFQTVFPILSSMMLFWLLIAPGGQTLSTGQFLAFSTAFALYLRTMLDVIETGLHSLNVIPMYERAKPILTQEVESQGSAEGRIQIRGSIEVSHVSFRYESDGPLILDDVNLRIEHNEFVAVVGPSGSGKSTLLRILLGFETPSEGGVFYDGQALSSLDLRAVRQQIGVVLQNSRVMAGDLYTNIVGNSGRSVDDAWRAARQAALDKDIEAMPMGMHTVLSPGGGTLSGGQRQRLLIARALASQPSILFFDEATSALDNVTQSVVSESLERLRVTRVVIAHRLSTIQQADKIVVLDRGQVVEVGRFDELMQKRGVFYALAKRQTL